MANRSRGYRTSSREVIDARGSIDSRTFNETHEISSIARDARDRHDPSLDTISHKTWYSRAGQGFDGVPDAGASANQPPLRSMRSRSVGFNGGVMSGKSDYPGTTRRVPILLIAGLVVILILIVAIIYLILR